MSSDTPIHLGTEYIELKDFKISRINYNTLAYLSSWCDGYSSNGRATIPGSDVLNHHVRKLSELTVNLKEEDGVYIIPNIRINQYELDELNILMYWMMGFSESIYNREIKKFSIVDYWRELVFQCKKVIQSVSE